MNRVLQWLIWKMAHPFSAAETNEPESNHEKPGEPDIDNNVATNVNELMPDIYSQEASETQPGEEILADDDTQPDLEIIENPSHSDERSEGFDPYNSGDYRFPKK